MEHLPGLEWCIGNRHVIRKCSLYYLCIDISLGWGNDPIIVEIAEYSESEILHVMNATESISILLLSFLHRASCAPQLIFCVVGPLSPTASTFFSPRVFEKVSRPTLSSFPAELKTSKINGSSNHTLASRHTQSVVEVGWDINEISPNGNL